MWIKDNYEEINENQLNAIYTSSTESDCILISMIHTVCQRNRFFIELISRRSIINQSSLKHQSCISSDYYYITVINDYLIDIYAENTLSLVVCARPATIVPS